MSKKFCIGILGGGQLAKMSTQAAVRLGFDVVILEKEKNSPAGMLTHNEFTGWVDDDKLLKQFAHRCDVITLENEFVDHHRLEILEGLGKKVFPSSTTIALIQDKLLQKETLAQNRIPVPRFVAVEKYHSFNEIASILGKPFVLKSRKMGYDGYGNALVKNEKEYTAGVERLSYRHSNLMAESFIHFSMELAVMVARTKNEIKIYPVVQTIQKNHICHTVIAPAKISKQLKKDCEEIAVESVKAVHGFGLFGIEMFLSDDESIIVNEMAPRPHNSGHYTIEGCVTSQFENHIRAVMGLPLGSTSMVNKAAVMINLLGKQHPQKTIDAYRTALDYPNVHLHIYGKAASRAGRKMGHITIVGDDAKKILKQANGVEKKIRL
ncbi:MAG: 5-(carboxyamino)imidazole ribonucleotide synthase [Ignavibacteriales bacterium]|nr:5-(carboxyamino)imidazole ribonucleotide synthase [Ignavibacteriales bacterium]